MVAFGLTGLACIVVARISILDGDRSGAPHELRTSVSHFIITGLIAMCLVGLCDVASNAPTFVSQPKWLIDAHERFDENLELVSAFPARLRDAGYAVVLYRCDDGRIVEERVDYSGTTRFEVHFGQSAVLLTSTVTFPHDEIVDVLAISRGRPFAQRRLEPTYPKISRRRWCGRQAYPGLHPCRCAQR